MKGLTVSILLILTTWGSLALAQREALPVRGVNVHNMSTPEMNAVSKMKLNWVRVDINWADVEAQRGVYEWRDSWVDGSIDAAVTRGLKIYANLTSVPAWACRTGGPVTRNCVPYDRDVWKRFVSETASRYRGLVSVYGIWNEPNVGAFWQGDAVEYVLEIFEPAARAIREGDPTARIASPDLSSTKSPRIDPQAFTDAITNARVADLVDIVSWHVYEEGGSFFCSSFKGPSGVRDRFFKGNSCERSQIYWIDRSALSGKPIFITETGFGNGGDAGANVPALFDVFRVEPRIEGVFFYELRDNSGVKTGLLREDGTWKPGALLLARDLAAGGEPRPPVLAESFENKPWLPVLHRWYLSSSNYAINGGALENLEKEFLAKISDVVARDFEITTTVQIADELDSPHNWTGLIGRTQRVEDSFRETGYAVFVRGTGGVGIFRAPDTLIAYGKSGVDPREAAFTLTFRGTGSRLSVLVNGREVLSAEDSTYASGYTGIVNYSLCRNYSVALSTPD